MQKHQLTNARTILSYAAECTDFSDIDYTLFTAIGRARDWDGQLSDEELESLSLIVLDFQPPSQEWAIAKADLLRAIEEELLEYETA